MSTHISGPNIETHHRKILIVEDSEFVHQIYRVAFRKLNQPQLTHVNNGVEGLAALEKSGRFDLIIVDLNMPLMDGLTFVREVRRRPEHKDTHVMFCTTEGKDPALRKEIDSLAQSYLRKPFGLDEIVARLTQVLPQTERRAN
ncbi:MAG: response regulator [Myxococcota bacterium]|nr:response regulator [Myxococcota bacterium]